MKLEDRGLDVARRELRSSTTINLGGIPIPLSSFRGEEVKVSLRARAELSFALTRESWKSAISKLVWPEITLGDAEFDGYVLARTSTEPRTRALLDDADSRSLVMDLVARDGAVSCDGEQVTFLIPDDAMIDESRLAAFVDRIQGAS